MADTIIEIFEERVNASGASVALRGPSPFQAMSWREWFDASERLAAGLAAWGVHPGDRIALISQTRPEWAILDIAIMMCGAVTVPLYPASTGATCAEILRQARPNVIIVEDPAQLLKLVEADSERLRRVLIIDEEVVFRHTQKDGRHQLRMPDLDVAKIDVRSMASLDALGRRKLVEESSLISSRRRAVRSTDIATIVFTSGTSGEPLGVMLTHENLVAEIQSLKSIQIIHASDAQLLFLPLAHIFARVLYLTAVGYGIETTFVNDLHRLKEYWQNFRPTFFAAVPHILEKIREQMLADFERSEWRGAVVELNRHVRHHQDGLFGRVYKWVQHAVLDPALTPHVRDVFGGRLRFVICGGAPMPLNVGQFFEDIGLDVLEGYGLTEVTAVATVNVPGEKRLGSVGRPLPGVEVAIEEDGEILIRGKNVMSGYLKRPDQTRQVLARDRWCRTGDLGEYDREGFLHITGRKKDIIVTSGGKNIAPAPLEAALRDHPLISSAIVLGDNRPYLVALIATSPENLATWRDKHPDRDARDEIHDHILKVNAALAPFEAVRRYDFIDNLDIGEDLTPTAKLNREIIATKYAERIENLYQREAGHRSVEETSTRTNSS